MGPGGSPELERLAGDLDLVSRPCAGLTESSVQLVLAGRAAYDAEAAVGAKDAERSAWIRLRAVDEKLGEAFGSLLRRRRGRAELEQAAPEALDACACRAGQRAHPHHTRVLQLEARRLGQWWRRLDGAARERRPRLCRGRERD